MNTTAFCSQLKGFLGSIKYDCDKMKKSVSTKSSSAGYCDLVQEETLFNGIEAQIDSIQRDLYTIETDVLGPLETRLSIVTLEEVFSLPYFV